MVVVLAALVPPRTNRANTRVFLQKDVVSHVSAVVV